MSPTGVSALWPEAGLGRKEPVRDRRLVGRVVPLRLVVLLVLVLVFVLLVLVVLLLTAALAEEAAARSGEAVLRHALERLRHGVVPVWCWVVGVVFFCEAALDQAHDAQRVLVDAARV